MACYGVPWYIALYLSTKEPAKQTFTFVRIVCPTSQYPNIFSLAPKEQSKAFAASQAEALLQLPMDPDAVITELDITTPLMRASENAHADVAELLLEAGARKELRDPGGSTALMFAAQRCRAELVVQLLLQAGAERDARDDEDSTALMYAACNGRVPAVRLLLEAGAQKDLRDKDGRTALMDAARGGHVPVVELLLEARADQDVRDNDGMTAQMLAVDDGHRQVAQLLGFTYKRKSSSSPTVAPGRRSSQEAMPRQRPEH